MQVSREFDSKNRWEKRLSLKISSDNWKSDLFKLGNFLGSNSLEVVDMLKWLVHPGGLLEAKTQKRFTYQVQSIKRN
jgi:hypothetical protein